MSAPEHPLCEGSIIYGLHDARLTTEHTLITAGHLVQHFCDSDCLRRVLETDERAALGRPNDRATERKGRCIAE